MKNWKKNKPTIGQLRPHILEKGIAHIIHAEDIDVGVTGDRFADVGEQSQSQLFALFRRFGQVHDFCALGFGHCEKVKGKRVGVESKVALYMGVTQCGLMEKEVKLI